MYTKEFRSIFPMFNSENLTDSVLDNMFSQRSLDKKYEVSDKGELGWLLKLPLPGIEKSNVSIEAVNQKSIKISVLEGNSWVKKSDRIFTLPELSDTDNISADLKNGILEISIPRADAEASRKIKIK